MAESQLLPEEPGERQGDELFALTPEVVREVAYALESGRPEIAEQLIEPLHASDIASLVEQLPADQREPLMAELDPEVAGDVLAEIEEAVRDDLLENMAPAQVAEAVATLDSDDAVYVLEDLKPSIQREVLEELATPEALGLADALAFPEDSAGRMMQRQLIAVPGFWTVGQVIDYMREAADLPEEFHQIFVIDTAFHPVGGVHLHRLLKTKRPVAISEIMEEEPTLIHTHTDQEHVGLAFRQYDLMTAGVIDDEGRLVGCITVDDIVEVVEEEVEEDVLRLAGVGDEAVSDDVFDAVRSRFVWLTVNLGTAILASAVIALFEATISEVVALAVLMPIVASMGGNAGTQTLTVAVRALATRDLTTANALRIVYKEVLVGGINGVAFAIMMGLIAGLWFSDPTLGGVIAAAMVINMLVAGLSGILVPMGLNAVKVDPAIASSVFVTTVTDVVGFFAFLGLAAVFLL